MSGTAPRPTPRSRTFGRSPPRPSRAGGTSASSCSKAPALWCRPSSSAARRPPYPRTSSRHARRQPGPGPWPKGPLKTRPGGGTNSSRTMEPRRPRTVLLHRPRTRPQAPQHRTGHPRPLRRERPMPAGHKLQLLPNRPRPGPDRRRLLRLPQRRPNRPPPTWHNPPHVRRRSQLGRLRDLLAGPPMFRLWK
jgi:hypothetical protein